MNTTRCFMGYAALGLALMVTTPLASASTVSKLTLNEISWLAGCWKAKPDASRFNNMEQWSKPFGNAMLGVGAELKSGQLSSWEHMKIEAGNGGKIQLVVRPHNQKEAVFTLTSNNPESLVFENPENSFPEKVTYRKEKDGSMEIRIDGKVKDKPHAALFPMVRMPCD